MARTSEQLCIIEMVFNVHSTSCDPESLVGKNIDDELFLKKMLVLYFKHATIKVYLNLSHVGLVAHCTIEAMAWILIFF